MRARYLLLAFAACGSPHTEFNDNTDANADVAVEAGAHEAAPNDSGLTFDDVTTVEAGGCTTLNIGILGNPGQNNSSNFQAWLVAAGTTVTRIETNATDPAINSSTIAGFDVVILDWLARDYSSTEATVLQARIAAGGGLITMSGYDNTINDFRANVLLVPFAVAYGGALLEGPVTTFATHPTTTGLTDVTFVGGYGVTDLGGNGSTRTPVAFIGTAAVGYAIELGAGRAFVWGDEWIEFDSEWSSNPEIKQFWVNIFAWVAPQGCPIVPT